ncbi:hypothetical protein Tco_0041180 [Tanacetum coccineum]
MSYCLALVLMARAFFASAGSVPSVRYSNNGVIHEYPSSSTTARIFLSSIDFSFRTSTMTCLVKWAKLVDAIFLSTPAFLFSLLGIGSCFALLQVFPIDLVCHQTRVYFCCQVNSTPSGFVRMSPAPNPSRHEDSSVKRIHGSRISSYVVVFVDGSFSSGRSTIKSAKIWSWSRQYLFDWLIRDNCAAKEIDWHFLRVSFRYALIASLAAQRKLLFFMQFFKVLNKGKDFSADFDKNLLKLASFPLRLSTSFSVLGTSLLLLRSRRRRLPSSSQFAFQRLYLQAVGGDRGTPVMSAVGSLGEVPLELLLPFYIQPVFSVTIPSFSGNLIIPCAVDGTAWIFMRPGRPMIPLYGDGDRTTIKFIRALVECSSSPRDAINNICPNGQDISPLNSRSGVVAGVIRLLTSGQSLLKQCSYKTSEADPPSTYMRWMR